MAEQTPMSGMSQGKTFLFGIVAGILVLCTVGFFVLLSMQLGDKDTRVAGNTNTGNPTQVAPSGDVAPTTITLEEVTDDEHIRGNKNAKITLVEYSDFQCPFCGTFEPTVDQMLEKYPDDVRVVYRHFPLLPQMHLSVRLSKGNFGNFTQNCLKTRLLLALKSTLVLQKNLG